MLLAILQMQIGQVIRLRRAGRCLCVAHPDAVCADSGAHIRSLNLGRILGRSGQVAREVDCSLYLAMRAAEVEDKLAVDKDPDIIVARELEDRRRLAVWPVRTFNIAVFIQPELEFKLRAETVVVGLRVFRDRILIEREIAIRC